MTPVPYRWIGFRGRRGEIGVKNYISFVFNIFHYILSLLLLLIIIVIYDKSFSALELFFFWTIEELYGACAVQRTRGRK